MSKDTGTAKPKKRRSGVGRRTSDAPYNADYFAQKHDIESCCEKSAVTATSSTGPQQSFFANNHRSE